MTDVLDKSTSVNPNINTSTNKNTSTNSAKNTSTNSSILDEINSIIGEDKVISVDDPVTEIIEKMPSMDAMLSKPLKGKMLSSKATPKNIGRWSGKGYHAEVAHDILHFYANEPDMTMRELFDKYGKSWPPIPTFLMWVNKNIDGVGDIFDAIEQARIMEDEQRLRRDLYDDTKGYIIDTDGNRKEDQTWVNKKKLLNDTIKHRQKLYDPRVTKKAIESEKVDSADAAKLLVNAVKFLSESKEKDVVSEQ